MCWHYLDSEEQQRLIEKAAGALEPGGLLLLREADAGAGFTFHVTRWGERIACVLRGEFGRQLHFRSAFNGLQSWWEAASPSAWSR